MSKYLNRVTLIGNVGGQPEFKQVGNRSLLTFAVATEESWQEKNGEKKFRVDWHYIKVWGKQADVLFPVLGSGKRLYVEGRLRLNQWERDGQKRSKVEIEADRVILLDRDRDIERAADREAELVEQE